MFALLFAVASAHYYLGVPRQVGGYGQYGYGPQPGFPLDPRGLSVFVDGIDAKPAGMFIAAGMDPKFLPMSTDGYDAGDAWIYGIPGMTREQVIEMAKRKYPMSAQLHHPENEELAPTWGQIVANGLLVEGAQGTGGTTGVATGSETVVINSGTGTGVATSATTDPQGTVVLQAGLYTVLSSAEGATDAAPEGATILTPGTYRVQATNSGGSSAGYGNLIHYYGESEYETPEAPEFGGVLLSRPRARRPSYYSGCAPEDWVIGVGCVQNLRMRTPFLAKPQWRRKL